MELKFLVRYRLWEKSRGKFCIRTQWICGNSAIIKASLLLTCWLLFFDIPGSKNEMSGDQVSKVYYEEKDLEKICRYCRRMLLY